MTLIAQMDNTRNGIITPIDCINGGAAQNDCYGFPEWFSRRGHAKPPVLRLFNPTTTGHYYYSTVTTSSERRRRFVAINLMVIFLPLTFTSSCCLELSYHVKEEFHKYLPTTIITRNKLQIELENNLAQQFHHGHYGWRFMIADKSPSIESNCWAHKYWELSLFCNPLVNTVNNNQERTNADRRSGVQANIILRGCLTVCATKVHL